MLDFREIKYMRLALSEARKAYDIGQVPIGAVLVIDNKVVGSGSNANNKFKDFFHHAENRLIEENARAIKRAKKNSLEVELYSTLEPCLMCFGAAVLNRIGRIVYGCPDPVAGATKVKPPTKWYRGKWPVIRRNVLRRECYDLFVGYMRETPGWENILPSFERLRKV